MDGEYKMHLSKRMDFSHGRSSRLKVFCRIDVLRNFAKFTGKHLCESLFFDKVAGFRPWTLFKKILWHRCFPVNFAKFLRTHFFTEHLRWLLLLWRTYEPRIISWFNVPIAQKYIFILFVSTSLLFEGVFSLWISLIKYFYLRMK